MKPTARRRWIVSNAAAELTVPGAAAARGAAQVSGHFLLSSPALCSWSSHHTDASGGVPVLAGPDRSDGKIRRCKKNDSNTECCSFSLVLKARGLIAPCICSVSRAPGESYTGPRLSLRIFWMMLRFCGIFAALRKLHIKIPKSGEMTGPGLAICICRGPCVYDM